MSPSETLPGDPPKLERKNSSSLEIGAPISQRSVFLRLSAPANRFADASREGRDFFRLSTVFFQGARSRARRPRGLRVRGVGSLLGGYYQRQPRNLDAWRRMAPGAADPPALRAVLPAPGEVVRARAVLDIRDENRRFPRERQGDRQSRTPRPPNHVTHFSCFYVTHVSGCSRSEVGGWRSEVGGRSRVHLALSGTVGVVVGVVGIAQ